MSVQIEIDPAWSACLAAGGLGDAAGLLARPTEDLVAHHDRRATQVLRTAFPAEPRAHTDPPGGSAAAPVREPLPAATAQAGLRGVRQVEGPAGPATFYVKRWFRRPLLDAVRDLVALKWPRCPALVERRAIDDLRAAGFQAPAWVALAYERRLGLPGRSALVVLGLDGVRSLDDVLKTDWPTFPRGRQLALIEAVANAVADLHRAGFRHRDLFTKHVLIGQPGHTSPPGMRSPDVPVAFVDLTRMTRHRHLALRHRARDLAALDVSTGRGAVSRTDRLRWLKRYVGTGRLDGRARRLIALVRPIRDKLARRRALRVYQ